MARTSKTTAQPAARPFWSKAGSSLGVASTSSVANAALFSDGYKAGYYGSKLAHTAQREAVRRMLEEEFHLDQLN